MVEEAVTYFHSTKAILFWITIRFRLKLLSFNTEKVQPISRPRAAISTEYISSCIFE